MTFLNKNQIVGTATSATTVVAPLAVIAGNLIVVGLSWVDASGSVTAAVTDSEGNTYAAGTKLTNAGTTASQMFFARAATNASPTITGTFSATSAYRSMIVSSYNNIVASGSPLDVEAAPATGNSTTPTTNVFTTTSANAIAIAFLAANPASAPGAGYNLRSTGNFANLEDRTLAAAGSNTASATAATGLWNAHAMAFKLVAAEVPVNINRNDPAIFYSPSTWNDDGTSANAINNGSYVKFSFTGTALTMNIVGLSGLSVYPTFRAYIDDLPAVDITPTSGQTAIPFAAGLTSGTHTVTIMLKAIPLLGRWDRTAGLKITSFTLDAGAMVSASALRPLRQLSFGDSITEGERTISTAAPPAGADAMLTVVPLIAKALNAEYGQIGFGGQGFAQAGSGGVPAFNTAWSQHSNGVSRLVGGLFSPAPDYITCMHGTNGGVQSDVATAIANFRSAAPNAWIFMIVPPGGFRRAAITAATSAAIAAGDLKLVLIDAGVGYQNGVDGTPSGTVATGPGNERSTDTIHVYPRANAEFAAEFMRQISLAIQPRKFTVVGS